jgi:hypothetical protein
MGHETTIVCSRSIVMAVVKLLVDEIGYVRSSPAGAELLLR